MLARGRLDDPDMEATSRSPYHAFEHTPYALHIQTHSKEAPMPMKSGPAMMFVELVPDSAPDGKAWRDKDVDALSKRWSQARRCFDCRT